MHTSVNVQCAAQDQAEGQQHSVLGGGMLGGVALSAASASAASAAVLQRELPSDPVTQVRALSCNGGKFAGDGCEMVMTQALKRLLDLSFLKPKTFIWLPHPGWHQEAQLCPCPSRLSPHAHNPSPTYAFSSALHPVTLPAELHTGPLLTPSPCHLCRPCWQSISS